MKTMAWIPVTPLLTVFAASACGDRQEPLGVAHALHVQAASAPIAVPVFFEFDDVNPCSGLIHTVTMVGTAWIHDLDGRVLVRMRRTITTSSGFQGRGTNTEVDNGNVLKFTLNDMLTHESGDRIRAQGLLVVDLSTSTVRVEKFLLACIGA